MKLLHIDSSIKNDHSVSRQITAGIVEHICNTSSGVITRYRDLVAKPLPHLQASDLMAIGTDDQSKVSQHEDLEAAASPLAEFLDADIVVIGAPMYNFTIPTQLKAWIDRILVAGKTFKYTEQGPVGLAGPKRVIIVLTRGGFYCEGMPLSYADHQEPYLRTVFGFIGVTDIEVIRAEGTEVSAEFRQRALNEATRVARELNEAS